jgi:hypothetical protein
MGQLGLGLMAMVATEARLCLVQAWSAAEAMVAMEPMGLERALELPDQPELAQQEQDQPG